MAVGLDGIWWREQGWTTWKWCGEEERKVSIIAVTPTEREIYIVVVKVKGEGHGKVGIEMKRMRGVCSRLKRL